MSGAGAVWEKLDQLAAAARARRILNLFDAPDRAGKFSARADGLLFDYSKTSMDAAARAVLIGLTDATGLAERRDAMFAGDRINETEDRAVLHVALRAPETSDVATPAIRAQVAATLARMADFADGIRAGAIRPPGGARFTDVINIGIGGSDLGPAMATRALAPYHDGPRLHFVANVDSAAFTDATRTLSPARTLVIVASKTFTTQETMTNARTAFDWLAAAVGDDRAGEHLVALSSAADKAALWGIGPDRVFGFADWVGGRYSLWGPIGLSLMLAIGPGNFRAMLDGGHAMDQHFRTAPAPENLPVLLALTGLWHRQVLGYPTRAVIPYEERLARLPAYLQQLEMESNGKSLRLDGSPLDRPSAPVVWGEPGTNGQHAFFQQLHQGTDVVPVEFLLGRQGHEPELARHHLLLAANCLAQSEALMRGRTLDEARAMLTARGLTGADLDRQARHRVFPGNRPSTTLIYPRLTPYVLGQIIALYEHRVFTEGVVLGINSFDQWGVELGKELANALVPMIEGRAAPEGKDGSTRMLLGALSESD
ncbi:MAG TPA: glucose-6-phosphate isomerase [Aliiroseovarius sp.]|nr:glucose-6-phosphate isomerase [Aliiroseovarius sp.]